MNNMENREIKFRIWDFEYKKMIYPTNGYAPSNYFSLGVDLQKSRLSYEHILMQYTGLKDKNGVEIYEGDILFSDVIYSKCEVVFGSFTTMKDDYGIEETSPKFCVLWDDKSGYSEIRPSRMSVIGNIYENNQK